MHISIIDDEKLLANKILKKLRGSGYAADAFYGYQDFITNGDSGSGLYIVDVSLGDGSGFDVIRWLRNNRNCKSPIIIISGFGDSENIVYGLDIWADDYLTKPVVPEELVARVKAMLRRPRNMITETIVEFKNLSINFSTKEILLADRPIFLSKTESLVLECLVENKDKIVSRDAIVEHAWWAHKYADISDNTFAVTLSNIRKKLRPHLNIRTVYNFGYILE